MPVMHQYVIIKVLPEALAQANALAVELKDSPVGVNSFGEHNAYNTSGQSSDPVEAYILKVAVYPATSQAVDEAITEIADITRHVTLEEAVGELKKVSE